MKDNKILYSTPRGVYILNEKEELIDRIIYPKNRLEEVLERMLKGELTREEEEFLEKYKPSYTTSLRISKKKGISLKRDIKVLEEGFDIREPLIEISKKEAVKSWQIDGAIISSVGALIEIQKAENLLKERVRRWVEGYWPEISNLSDEVLLKVLLAGLGIKPCEDVLEGLNIENMSCTELGEPGEDFNEDYPIIFSLVEEVYSLKKREEEIEGFIRKIMLNKCPNLSLVATPLIGAHLIALSGGLQRLASFPSSTVQLLGAEKGFFRYLKKGGKIPKHGVIFQHPLVHGVKPWNRGKASRALSGKITIAARLDALKGEDLGKELLSRVKQRIDDIERRYPTPPEKKDKRRTGRRGVKR